MAKIKNKKPKTPSIFLCCFGPPTNKPAEPNTTIKKRSKRGTWISRLTIRIRNTSCKTVPLEDHYSNPKPKPKPKPKSTLRHNDKPQALPPPPPSTLPLPPQPATPYYTPSQTRHGTNKKRAEEERREEGRESQSDESKGEERGTTTLKKQKKWVVGMSIIVVTLVIMVCWGRLCAILCTSAWFYYIPRFNTTSSTSTSASQNDHLLDLDLDLDSEEYKKKVIMDGILHRNRGGQQGSLTSK